jgi:hypothetical protein
VAWVGGLVLGAVLVATILELALGAAGAQHDVAPIGQIYVVEGLTRSTPETATRNGRFGGRDVQLLSFQGFRLRFAIGGTPMPSGGENQTEPPRQGWLGSGLLRTLSQVR